MWAVWPRILSDGETPVELIESAGWPPIPCDSGGCHPVYPKRVEGATLFEHLPPTPLRSGWGLTRSTG
jgi:hypothetical protein